MVPFQTLRASLTGFAARTCLAMISIGSRLTAQTLLAARTCLALRANGALCSSFADGPDEASLTLISFIPTQTLLTTRTLSPAIAHFTLEALRP